MEEKETECKVALYAKDKRSQWYVDSGCSKHMIGDQDKFLSLKRKEKGRVTFGDNVSLPRYLERVQSVWEIIELKKKMCY
jgi:hypothetical protein